MYIKLLVAAGTGFVGSIVERSAEWKATADVA
jgi:hypothetical protein